MVKLSTGTVDGQQMGKNALAHIQHYSPDRFAKNLIAAATHASHPLSAELS
jgi:hypothetical protein